MIGFSISDRARRDLDEIMLYIAQDNVPAALGLMDRFDEMFALLTGQPGMGVAITEVQHGVSMVPVERYLVFYEKHAQEIRIFRVLHSAREWRTILTSSGLQ